ncbi:MGMT family protein [Candidatus Microgenomates bacterium]|nr:MGMT family protein [Candidatus Microgenomates bacterium]
MVRPKSEFRNKVLDLVAQIPKGRVMTYGQIAALCGQPRAARIVGGIAHFGPEELPWQRVVNKNGGLASGYTTGGREAHKRDLEADGVEVGSDYRVDIAKLLWWPPQYRQ